MPKITPKINGKISAIQPPAPKEVYGYTSAYHYTSALNIVGLFDNA